VKNSFKRSLDNTAKYVIMKYIEYLKWRISLLKFKNIVLFPIEKTIKENDKKEN